jgi:hypothetical protein
MEAAADAAADGVVDAAVEEVDGVVEEGKMTGDSNQG